MSATNGEQIVKESKIKSSYQKILKSFSVESKSDLIMFYVGVVIIVMLFVIAILLPFRVFATEESKAANASYYGRNESSESISDISINEKEQRLLSKDTDVVIKNGRFDFFALTEFEIFDDQTYIPMSLSNPSYNDCVLIFTLTDGNGKVIYRSLGVEPGKSITNVNLNTKLNYGENILKLYIAGYKVKNKKDKQTYTKLGNSIANIYVHYNSVPIE